MARAIKMTQTHDRILKIIKECHGKHRAMSYKMIAKTLGIHPRVVRKYVADLIKVYREPIGSCYDSIGGGYFWITTVEEARESREVMYKQGVQTIIRARDIYNIPYAELMGQLKIDLAPEVQK